LTATSDVMKLAVIVDSPKRDLDGAVLTAYHLARRGAEVYIVPMYQQGYDLPILRPDGVLVNYARENNRDLLMTYRALGMCVMVMDTEGGVVSESGLDAPRNWARELRASGLGRYIDRYFFWGTRLHDAFARESGIPAEALHVTGCPRYDFCVNPWRHTLEFKDRNYVLVNTNFSAINPKFTPSKDAERRIFLQLGWSKDYVDRLFAEWGRVFPLYLSAIEQLARRKQHMRIRVRPHPFEDENVYLQRYGSTENVVIDASGSALPAIANATCVLHLNCGTAVDALMLGTPAISMEFLNSETMRSHAKLPATVSIRADSFDELEGLVADPAELARRQVDEREALVAQFVEPWFHTLDGRASERLADAAMAAVAGRPSPRRSIRASMWGGRKRSIGRLVTGMTCNLLGSKSASQLLMFRLPERRSKAITLDDVRSRIEGLHRVAPAQEELYLSHARHPVSGSAMASISISTA
jgi:surface carbohydrate biosynthesis protein